MDVIYNYVSKSSPISPLPFRRKKEHTSFRIINVSFFQSPGKRVNHRVTEIRRRRMPPPPVRSTSFQVSPLPSWKKGTEGREFFLPGSLSSFFRRRSGNLYHHPLRIYTRTHTHLYPHARRFERELVSEGGPTFLRLHRVNRGGGGGGKRPLRSLSKGVASLSDGSLPVEVTRKGRDATHFVFNHSDG